MTNAEKLELYPVSVTMLSQDEGGGFFAWFTNIGASLSGEGLTRQEAIQDLMDASESYLEVLDERGVELPEVPATPDWTMLSGRVTLRLPRSLHAQLVAMAEMEGASLNSLITCILESAAASPTYRPTTLANIKEPQQPERKGSTRRSKAKSPVLKLSSELRASPRRATVNESKVHYDKPKKKKNP